MLDKYLKNLEYVGKSAGTQKTYSTVLKKFMTWLEETSGVTDPREITSIDAVEYRAYLQKLGRKPNTVNTALSIIEAFCAWMAEQGYLDHNPVAIVKRVDQVPQPPKWLTKGEKYRVLRTALKEKDSRNKVIILMLLLSGLRASELVNLKPDDVYLSDRKGFLDVLGKGNKKRIVPIPNDLRKPLGEYLVNRKAISTWLFSSQRGEKLTYIGLYQLCVEIGKKAGVEELTPHVLRHTYCHDSVSKGIPLHIVQKMAGHAKLDTTLLYTQPSQEELQAEVEKLNFT